MVSNLILIVVLVLQGGLLGMVGMAYCRLHAVSVFIDEGGGGDAPPSAPADSSASGRRLATSRFAGHGRSGAGHTVTYYDVPDCPLGELGV